MRRAAVAVAVLVLASCGAGEDGAGRTTTTGGSAPPTGGVRVVLSSPAFDDGGSIPVRYTCDGSGVSPPLSWSGGPTHGAFVLIVDDPDAPGGDFVHWTVAGPIMGRRFPEGSPPPGSTQGLNSLGHERWDPLCPPGGDPPHRYRFTLYVADVIADPGPRASIERMLEIARQFGRGTATLTGTYGRA